MALETIRRRDELFFDKSEQDDASEKIEKKIKRDNRRRKKNFCFDFFKAVKFPLWRRFFFSFSVWIRTNVKNIEIDIDFNCEVFKIDEKFRKLLFILAS